MRLIFIAALLLIASAGDKEADKDQSEDPKSGDGDEKIDYGEIAGDYLHGKENPAFFQKWVQEMPELYASVLTIAILI
jgi:hypothetical protein